MVDRIVRALEPEPIAAVEPTVVLTTVLAQPPRRSTRGDGTATRATLRRRRRRDDARLRELRTAAPGLGRDALLRVHTLDRRGVVPGLGLERSRVRHANRATGSRSPRTPRCWRSRWCSTSTVEGTADARPLHPHLTSGRTRRREHGVRVVPRRRRRPHRRRRGGAAPAARSISTPRQGHTHDLDRTDEPFPACVARRC